MQKKSPAKQYTYTVSDSRQSKKQQKKVPKEKVVITKSKLKKGAKGSDHLGGFYPTSAYDVKKKEVTQKRANRKTSRKSGKWVQPIAGSKSIAQQKFPEIKEENQGKFTAWAKKNGFKDACSAASAVMKSKKKYSSNVVKMANYANNFGCSTAKSPATQTDKKIKKMEEKTKRIGIRQGEKTRRVEARNKK
ncbi:hypothetical protein [Croceibacter atlanticus]|uniref:hypothetical protein n=1 Tax=Croceibacter atlanticus TaxID=313588 RepID=UPI0030D6F637|tara:strand:- start:47 stop:619 length:573 start_codon:yes stop_codon:yes gene_type:complete